VNDAASEGMLKARAALELKLQKARKAVGTAQVGLNAAIGVYNKIHDAAVKHGRFVPPTRHKKLVGGITKAQDKLTRRLRELYDAEGERKEYYRPL